MRHRFPPSRLALLFLITGISAGAETPLLPCQGSDSNAWHNCVGKQETFAGGVYEGGFRFGKRDGVGQWYEVYVLSGRQRQIYVGEYKADMRHGRGEEIDGAGNIYNGEWQDDQKDGQGVMKYRDGSRYVGAWKKGSPKGQGTMTWSDGRVYVGEFSNEYGGGQGTLTWPNGAEFVGEVNDGTPWGDGTLTYPDGAVLTGRFERGKYVGPSPNHGGR
jgi:hypothetical protein